MVALELQNTNDQVMLVKLTGRLSVWVPYQIDVPDCDDIPDCDEDCAAVSIDGRYELVPPNRDSSAGVLVVPPRSRVFVDAKIRPLDQAEVDMQMLRIPVEGWSEDRLPEDVRADIGIAPFTDLQSQFDQLLEWGLADLEFQFETPDRMTLSSNGDQEGIPFNRLDIATTRWPLTLRRPF